MRRLTLALVFGVGVACAGAPAGSVREADFRSDALGVSKHYLVWLPPGYDGGTRRYPVIYMLHGLSGDERNWVELGHIGAAAEKLGLQAIIVMPDGDASFYSDWVTPARYEQCIAAPKLPFQRPGTPREGFCVRRANYETYIVKDLIGHVDATYRTIADRRGRAIGGLSMGGFGALVLAFRHPDVFASVASHSGVDALLYAGPRPFQPGQGKLATDLAGFIARAGEFGRYWELIFGTKLESWQAHDPASLAAGLKPGALAIYLDCGSEDEFGLDVQAAYLDEVLTARGIAHGYAKVPFTRA